MDAHPKIKCNINNKIFDKSDMIEHLQRKIKHNYKLYYVLKSYSINGGESTQK